MPKITFNLYFYLIMGELLVLCFMLIPQTVAGVYAKSIGKNFWFWFFISFLIPIISLIVLLLLDKGKDEKRKGYRLADHVTNKDNNTQKSLNQIND